MDASKLTRDELRAMTLEMQARLFKDGDPFDGDQWNAMQVTRFALESDAERDRWCEAANVAAEQRDDALVVNNKLTREVADLRAALQPFADLAGWPDVEGTTSFDLPAPPDDYRLTWQHERKDGAPGPTIGDCRKAAALLAKHAPPEANTPPAVRAEAFPGNPPVVCFVSDANETPADGHAPEKE
jgi:hypothetical protein